MPEQGMTSGNNYLSIQRRGWGRGQGRTRSRGHGGSRSGALTSNPREALTTTNERQEVMSLQSGSESGRHIGNEERSRRWRGRGRRRRGYTSQQPSQNRQLTGTRRSFGGHLTTIQPPFLENVSGLNGDAPDFIPGQTITQRSPHQATLNPPPPKSRAPDLTSQIHEDIDNGQYECGICTEDITRWSKIWFHESGCWAVAHLSCVKQWFKKSDRERENSSTWRCPGCNSQIEESPKNYLCWCGKESNPNSISGLPPHSCGQTCGKLRETCPHPCSTQCHAGPCPKCTVMGPPESCFCGKSTSTKRCIDTDYKNGWSCDELCGDLLPCGRHACERKCHGGLCGSCDLPTDTICYCGKLVKTIPCETIDDVRQSFDYGQINWSATEKASHFISPDHLFEGSFECGQQCGREFDCGVHSCQRSCHEQEKEPAHCPFSPDHVKSCPCGKTPLIDILEAPRTSCQDDIPQCNKTCGKALFCGHRCSKRCHTDHCGPCFEMVEVSCRCGRITCSSLCPQGVRDTEPVCARVCRAQLNCGRHKCGERCCSGEKNSIERRKAKNTNMDDIEPEHICLRVCDRLLKCGMHRCQKTCHKGPCSTCLEAIFEEIKCSCGRTVLQPPQPCGTRPPECRFNCTRARSCGHNVPHNCHTDDVSCPKCPFLLSKKCMCGKQIMTNQPCWLADVRCGKPCGKLLKCGAHTCQKTCHRPGECEDAVTPCRQACGQARNFCGHVCTESCHCPLPCNEDKPCQSKAILLCACQHKKQEIKCLASNGDPYPSRKILECDNECLRLQRNRKLAEALHIDPVTHTDDHIPYSDTTLKLYTTGLSWCQAIEKEFRLFAVDAKMKRKRFDPMPSQQRAFLHSLAEDFGFDTLSEDPEPYRHVSVFKTPRFLGPPRKTLAQSLKLKNTKLKSGRISATSVPDHAVKTTSPRHEPFNAFILTNPKFGVTVDDLTSTLDSVFQKHDSSIFFEIAFLHEEILVKATVKADLPWKSTVTEKVMEDLKSDVANAIIGNKLAGSVFLATADAAGTVVRREQGTLGTWNSVVSRATRRTDAGEFTGPSRNATSTLPFSPQGTSLRGESRWVSLAGNSFAPMSTIPATMPSRSSAGYVALRLKKEKVPDHGAGNGESQSK